MTTDAMPDGRRRDRGQAGPWIGDPAPALAGTDQHGQDVDLTSARAESAAVLVVFYPYAFSRVCSGELQQLRDHQAELQATVRLVAVSCDPVFALRAFADAEGIGFPLVSDFWPHGAVARAYGVFDETRGCARRASFLLDAAGILRWQVEVPMGEARSMDDYRAAIAALPDH